MAARDREETHRGQQRDARRDAYAVYLTASLAAYRAAGNLFGERRTLTTESWPERRGEVKKSNEDLLIALSIVRMEGPREVAAVAKKVAEGVQSYWRLTTSAVRPSSAEADQKEAEQALTACRDATAKIIDKYAEVAELELARSGPSGGRAADGSESVSEVCREQ